MSARSSGSRGGPDRSRTIVHTFEAARLVVDGDAKLKQNEATITRVSHRKKFRVGYFFCGVSVSSVHGSSSSSFEGILRKRIVDKREIKSFQCTSPLSSSVTFFSIESTTQNHQNNTQSAHQERIVKESILNFPALETRNSTPYSIHSVEEVARAIA